LLALVKSFDHRVLKWTAAAPPFVAPAPDATVASLVVIAA
jgi:hypothetical protein